jgi:hypothetical protein
MVGFGRILCPFAVERLGTLEFTKERKKEDKEEGRLGNNMKS